MRIRTIAGLVCLVSCTAVSVATAQNIQSLLGTLEGDPIKVNDQLYVGTGFGNTFLIITDEGNVVIDTSLVNMAGRLRKQLREISDAPVRYIIATHGHEDHVGGIPTWKEDGTEIVMQRNFLGVRDYQRRLAGFFADRNAAQFGLDPNLVRLVARCSALIEPTILVDEKYTFELGGLTFECLHTPGETYDHMTVWIPEMKAAFVGDNFYDSFPNMYTLRGTRPRWALDYVDSLNRVLELEPQILLPSHGQPIEGAPAVRSALTRYRDAIQYVHDATVAGMNEGKDVYTLMREIELPPELDLGEAYGKVSWSVRGIYEGYVGWFDGNPATMYEVPPSSVDGDLVEMAGGADKVAARATELLAGGDAIRALHLADAALAADPQCRAALEARLAALKAMLEKAPNPLETGWLGYGIRTTEAALRDK